MDEARTREEPLETASLERLQALFEAAKAAQDGGRWEESLAAYEAVLHRLPVAEGEWSVEVLRRIGAVHYFRGDLELASDVLEASCAAARAHGALRHLASGLNLAATVHQSAGRLAVAEAMYLEAADIAEAAGHSRLAVMIEQNLGTIASVRGDSGAALHRYGRALERYEQTGDGQGVAWVLNNIGMVRTDLRDWVAAAQAFERAMLIARSRGDTELLGTVQLNRADLYLQLDHFDDARACIDQAFELFGRLGSRAGLGESYKLYGSLFRASGKLQLADAHLATVTELAAAAEFLLLEAEARVEHALVYLDLGRNTDALRALNRAHQLFGELRARRELLDIEKRLDALERSYLQVVRAWGESIESKDHYTAGHCQRVADLTVRLAAAVGFTGRDLTWIRMGGFLHDVGKTGVDAAILNKPGKLDETEWEQMRNHTVLGDAIVAELEFPWDIRPIVRSHHERWDGTGYPDGIAGEAIPLTARILCVADVFDALTTTRSYRPAFTQQKALQIMATESGLVFDPELFELFCRMLAEEAASELARAG
jgi:putative nucleotidyltransferase with HDIG domain